MRLTAGDRKPDLVIDLSDGLADVDLSAATTVTITGYMDRLLPAVVFEDTSPTIDGNTATHAWVDGETDIPGRIWITCRVEWADGGRTFPELGELAVDID